MNSQMSFPLNVKALDDSGEFSGYASVFHEKDRNGDIIPQGAFQKSLDSWRQKGAMPPLLWQHKQDEPIGIFKSIEEDEHGLRVKGELLIKDDPTAKRIHSHLKAGSISGLSVGFIPKDLERKKDGFYIKEVDLVEISLVTVPANSNARIISVKEYFLRGELPAPKDIEKALRDVGFSGKQAKALMADGLKALLPRDVCNKTDEALNEVLTCLKSLKQHIA